MQSRMQFQASEIDQIMIREMYLFISIKGRNPGNPSGFFASDVNEIINGRSKVGVLFSDYIADGCKGKG